MILSLIGMSGSGKSYWSKKLEAIGFQRFCCDDMIEEKLAPDLVQLGYQGITDVAKWMGQPYEIQFPENERKYLLFEIEAMNHILNLLEKDNSRNFVIDTTGSVIYTSGSICRRLKNLSRVVYLEIPQTIQNEMFELYIKNPKPVIWGDLFTQRPGESRHDALARCYRELLRFRSVRYERYADVIVPYHLRHSDVFTSGDFLNFVLDFEYEISKHK